MNQYKNKVFRLQGKLKQYDWGGSSFLAHLLQIPNPESKPFAEFWLGAHDGSSSEMLDSSGHSLRLNEYIKAFTPETLGKRVADQFGQLPYLLKVLDVRRMLSIQVHPSKKSAAKEFLEENKKGVPLTAQDRNYKDANHKPELMLALSEFWLLHGFKSPEQLIQSLNKVPELNLLISDFERGGLKELYRTVMEMDQSGVNDLLKPLIDRLIPAYQENRISRDSADYWIARAALAFNKGTNIDRGIFSIYFFNLLNLHPGEAIFQDSGLPHAYLEGQNIEIMANSDNVLRGGLSSKHIDVKELMKHIRFETTIPAILHGTLTDGKIKSFQTPSPDFELGQVIIAKGAEHGFHSYSAEIYFALCGELVVQEEGQNEFSISTGQAFISFDLGKFSVKSKAETALIRASVPLEQPI
jgi:mannose-6-phosphate isomerase